MARDILRRVRLRPYRSGMGPRFGLVVWDTGRRHSRGTSMLGYELTIYEDGRPPAVLFSGEDFSGSPLHADDSDKTIGALLGFLTLRPGDTDREYFDGYSEAQRAYCAEHAEALGAYCAVRFGED